MNNSNMTVSHDRQMTHKNYVDRRSIGTHDLLRVDLQNIVLVDLCPGLVIPTQQKDHM